MSTEEGKAGWAPSMIKGSEPVADLKPDWDWESAGTTQGRAESVL